MALAGAKTRVAIWIRQCRRRELGQSRDLGWVFAGETGGVEVSVKLCAKLHPKLLAGSASDWYSLSDWPRQEVAVMQQSRRILGLQDAVGQRELALLA